MALIKCIECGKEISDRASDCPNCGCPVEHNENIQPVKSVQNPGPSVDLQRNAKKRGVGCLMSLLVSFLLITAIAVFGVLAAANIEKENSSVDSTNVLAKDQAHDIDNQIWEYVVQVINANNSLMATMNSYSSGTVAEIDFYNASKDFESYAQSMWSATPNISDSNGKKYLESCRDYIIIEQQMAKDIMKYLDDKSNKNLSTVQNDIERCNQAVQIVMSNRGTFLSMYGFTADEIKEITKDMGIE